ncbi:hypothetical protein CEXT_137881 [Caerostris extrusa]|uniref:Uncharacterized protein n=1 Tax=Caerostris extrusa TaxID=172846 RepID=A0AAV4P9X7_CAEEX|nr:hypothetical protein CEXT_137881 [Caerostris extrusa]
MLFTKHRSSHPSLHPHHPLLFCPGRAEEDSLANEYRRKFLALIKTFVASVSPTPTTPILPFFLFVPSLGHRIKIFGDTLVTERLEHLLEVVIRFVRPSLAPSLQPPYTHPPHTRGFINRVGDHQGVRVFV